MELSSLTARSHLREYSKSVTLLRIELYFNFARSQAQHNLVRLVAISTVQEEHIASFAVLVNFLIASSRRRASPCEAIVS